MVGAKWAREASEEVTQPGHIEAAKPLQGFRFLSEREREKERERWEPWEGLAQRRGPA